MDKYDYSDSKEIKAESNQGDMKSGEVPDGAGSTKHAAEYEASKINQADVSTIADRMKDTDSLGEKANSFIGKPQSSHLQSGPRRSSSRSIKRPKFDDELVDTSALKRSSHRRSSESSPSDQKSKKTSKQLSQASSHSQSRKKVKKIKPTPVPTDFGRWRPTDDLSLISAVTQTCDLQSVHLAVRFSCSFTMKEIQERWFALLYDPLVSRLAQQSMKALPSDVIEKILNNALWSRDEDCILADLNIDDNPTLTDFQELRDQHIDIFHNTRTAESLQDHWLLLRHYELLNCQVPRNIVSTSAPISLAEMEGKIIDDQVTGCEDDALNQELSVSDRYVKREIKRLEEEIPQWEILIDNSGHLEGYRPCDFNNDALAILKGRVLKYLITKNQVVIGRHSCDANVDIDLSIEGPSLKISRQQGMILYEDGIFYLENCGKRPFYINGFPLATGQSARLVNDSMIEIYCIKLLFLINPNIDSIEEQRAMNNMDAKPYVKSEE